MVENGDLVKVEYTGRLEDGSIFDTTDADKAKEAEIYFPEREYGTLEVRIGVDKLMRGFEKAIMGMKLGEERTVKLPPEEAFNHYREDLVVRVPIDAFKKKGIEPKAGMALDTPRGLAVITAVSEEEGKVAVDYNHPLAGKTIVYEIKVVGIQHGDLKKEESKKCSLNLGLVGESRRPDLNQRPCGLQPHALPD